MRSVQRPVNCRRPMTIRSTPPTLETLLPLLTNTLRSFSDLSRNTPDAINGRPSPMQYPNDRTAPRTALDSWNASACTLASAGPIHGVQPTPKRNPRIGAPMSPPLVEIFGLIVGIIGNAPRKITPIRIVSTPRTRVIISSLTATRAPSSPKRTP